MLGMSLFNSLLYGWRTLSIGTNIEGHYRVEEFLGESSYVFVDQPKALYDNLDVLLSTVEKR
jgi:hypothetical protein